MYAKGEVLLVDDDPKVLKILSAILTEEGYKVLQSGDADTATAMICRQSVDVVMTDLGMQGKAGMYFFDYLLKNHPEVPVIVLTARATIETAVSTMTRGAFYFFMKPPDYQTLKEVLARAVEQRELKRTTQPTKEICLSEEPFPIIGDTPEMQRLFEIIEAVKLSPSNVLVCGETGTGKELVARALSNNGNGEDLPFVAVNCAAIPKELIEVELFGCEKGAYTGSVSRRTGKFEEAANGTIFLDEISELELSMQAKLLRVLQEREIERVGSNKKIKVEFRLIAATNRDLAEEVKKGRFREDLYYRINVIDITVPPLRERKEDIPLLATAFFKEYCERERKTLYLSSEVMQAFMEFDWPGNVRQLRNIIERSIVLCRNGSVTLTDLPAELYKFGGDPIIVDSGKTLKEIELHAIKGALQECNGNKSRTAKMLNISRKALYKRLKDEIPFGQPESFSNLGAL